LKGGVSILISTSLSKIIETCSGVTNALAIILPSFPLLIGIELISGFFSISVSF